MQIQVLKENLFKTIQAATKFISTRNQLPILSHIAIEALEDGIYVTATSLDVGVRLRMAGKILKKGSAVVPGKLMYEVVQSLPIGSVELVYSEDDGLRVISQRMKSKIQTMNIADFPPFPMESVLLGEFETSSLDIALQRVGYSFSTDEARPVLTGILWRLNEGEMVTTDGYRLGLVKSKEKLQNLNVDKKSVILPGKFFIQLIQVIKDLGIEKITCGIIEQSQQMVLSGDGFWGVVRLLTGDYPKYEAIIPENSEIEILADREQLLSAVRAASVFARDSANIVRMEIGKEIVKVSANAPQLGEQIVDVEAKFIKEGEGAIAFNAKYLLDFLSRSEAAEVGFGMTDSLRAGLFYDAGDDNYIHIIMPVRVRD